MLLAVVPIEKRQEYVPPKRPYLEQQPELKTNMAHLQPASSQPPPQLTTIAESLDGEKSSAQGAKVLAPNAGPEKKEAPFIPPDLKTLIPAVDLADDFLLLDREDSERQPLAPPEPKQLTFQRAPQKDTLVHLYEPVNHSRDLDLLAGDVSGPKPSIYNSKQAVEDAFRIERAATHHMLHSLYVPVDHSQDMRVVTGQPEVPAPPSPPRRSVSSKRATNRPGTGNRPSSIRSTSHLSSSGSFTSLKGKSGAGAGSGVDRSRSAPRASAIRASDDTGAWTRHQSERAVLKVRPAARHRLRQAK